MLPLAADADATWDVKRHSESLTSSASYQVLVEDTAAAAAAASFEETDCNRFIDVTSI